MAHSTTTTTIPSTATSTSTTSSYLLSEHFDKFFQSCSILALSKKIQNVGIVSCQYSSNVYINKITDFIYLNQPNPSIFIVPLFHNGRISLAVFYIAEKRIGYYDSLKQPPIYSLSFAKTAIEKYLKCTFGMQNQELINSTINDNPVPELANFHICRIAEEICLHGRIQKIPGFDIILEAQRIKKLIQLVTDKSWKGEWIAALNGPRIELINNQNSISETVDEIAALASVVEAFDGGNSNSKRSSNKNVNQSPIIPITKKSHSRDKEKSNAKHIHQVINKLPKISSTSMHDFDVKYPIIAKMLTSYLNFTKRRSDRYGRSKNTCSVKKVFDWKKYTQMDHSDMEEVLAVLSDLPFFDSLSEADKISLFKRFWIPFSLLERIYDTLNSLDSCFLDENFIVLQNGDIFEVDGLCKLSNLAEMEKITFNSWKALLPLLKKLNPHCLEVMYIFCCILWNSSYLEKPLSEESEEIIRRGRLIIHKEMKEFYNYDDVLWERIYALRHLMVVTEESIKDPGRNDV